MSVQILTSPLKIVHQSSDQVQTEFSTPHPQKHTIKSRILIQYMKIRSKPFLTDSKQRIDSSYRNLYKCDPASSSSVIGYTYLHVQQVKLNCRFTVEINQKGDDDGPGFFLLRLYMP
jgi:hypothetical protein